MLLWISNVIALRAVSKRARRDITRLLEASPWDVTYPSGVKHSRPREHAWLKHVLDANVRIRSLTVESIRTVLSDALQAGYAGVVQEVVKLLEPGDLHERFVGSGSRSQGRRWTPLHFACQSGDFDLVRAVLTAPGVLPIATPAVDHTDSYSRQDTPLHAACESRNVDIVRALLDSDRVDVNAAGYKSRTPLHVAARFGCLEVFELLLSHALVDVNAAGYKSRTPLHVAALFGRFEVFELLLSHALVDRGRRDKSENNVLHFAVCGGNIAIVELILRENLADVNSGNILLETPLHLASGAAVMIDGNAVGGKPEILKLLLKHTQIDVCAPDQNGCTALHWAASYRGDYACLEALVADGRVDVNVRNNVGETPLHKATSMSATRELIARKVKTVEFLMSRKDTDINAQSDEANKRKAPLHTLIGSMSAAWRDRERDMQVFRMYMSNPAIDVNSKMSGGNTFLHKAAVKGWREVTEGLLSHDKIDLSVVNDDGDTAFHLLQRNSIYRGNQALIKRFFERPSFDPNLQDNKGDSALHCLARHFDGIDAIKDLLVFESLNLNLQNSDGNTPLHLAANYGKKDFVALLYLHGLARQSDGIDAIQSPLLHDSINPNVQNNDGNTALHVAATNGQMDVVALLCANDRVDFNMRNEHGERFMSLLPMKKDRDVHSEWRIVRKMPRYI